MSRFKFRLVKMSAERENAVRIGILHGTNFDQLSLSFVRSHSRQIKTETDLLLPDYKNAFDSNVNHLRKSISLLKK